MGEAPGHATLIGERAAATIAPASTSNAFVVGICERGSGEHPELTRSLTEFEEKCGERTNASAHLYDAVDVAFREGCSAIYVSRLLGGDALASEGDLLDADDNPTLHVAANSPGAWGDGLSVVATPSGSDFKLVIKNGGSTVDSSPDLADNDEAVAWALSSGYVRLENLSTVYEPTGDPASQTLDLAGGDDDTGALTDDDFEAALDRFSKDLGPGQVAAPWFSSEDAQSALLDHAATHNRRAIPDLPDGNADDLKAAALALRGEAGRFGGVFGPFAVCPGVSRGSRRTVPYSAVQLGLIARAEAAGVNPNRAAAGKYGRARYAFELTQHFTDAERAELNDSGVNCATLVRGVVTTMGNRTLTNPLTDSDWKWFSASRLVMAVAELADEVMADFDFEQIDGHGNVLRDLQGELSGRACMPFYRANALYGQTPDEAFVVNTGPDLNTPTTIAAGRVKAQIGVRVSESAEFLTTEIVKVPTTESLVT